MARPGQAINRVRSFPTSRCESDDCVQTTWKLSSVASFIILIHIIVWSIEPTTKTEKQLWDGASARRKVFNLFNEIYGMLRLMHAVILCSVIQSINLDRDERALWRTFENMFSRHTCRCDRCGALWICSKHYWICISWKVTALEITRIGGRHGKIVHALRTCHMPNCPFNTQYW